ncbi:MAG: peptidoglycan DL-endopeptidase CwlO [Acidimicrobiaceae bacterium]|nr:peptidoglycan DL-endopeptidase CwlO [Acidimicrobiaceae bacterium]
MRRRAPAGRLLGPLVVALLLIAGLTAAVVTRQSGHGTSVPTALSGASRPSADQPTPSGGQPGPGQKGQKQPAKQPATTVKPPPPASTTTAPPPTVPPAGKAHTPTAIITLPGPIAATVVQAVRGLKGVEAVEVVDVGTVVLQGAPAVTVGVDPGTFRNFTPAVTASADRLWQYIASGTLASSFEMSRDRQLALGAEVPVVAAGPGPTTKQWLGAFMSVGLPGIDLVVSRQMSGPLGLASGAGLVVSAPSADPFVLQSAVKSVAHDASVVLMRPGLALGSAPGHGSGGGVTAGQLSTALTAAVSRLGKPYVWGGTGPNGFDCSGLVGWSFAAAGISMPRTAAEQALAGPAVAVSQLQPGDLLFWAYDPSDPGFIDHVAIYLGNGQMIEAPQTGQTVHVIPLQKNHLVGAVRINPTVSARLGGPWLR